MIRIRNVFSDHHAMMPTLLASAIVRSIPKTLLFLILGINNPEEFNKKIRHARKLKWSLIIIILCFFNY